MADGNVSPLRATPALRLVPPQPRQPSFRTYGGDVFWGTARLSAETVEHLLSDFQREAGRTGDWSVHDDLQAARDDFDPLPAA